MSVKVMYKGNEILSSDTDESRKLLTSGKYLEGDVIIENTQDGSGDGYLVTSEDNGDGTQTLHIEDGFFPTDTIEITENDTYDVRDKGTAVVAVLGEDPYEKFLKYINNEMVYLKIAYCTQVPTFNGYGSIKFVSIDSCESISNSTFYTSKIQYIRFGSVYNVIPQSLLLNSGSNRLTLIIGNENVALISGSPHGFSANRYIYVPTNLVETYKVTSNWTSVANNFKGYNESPIYDESITYSAGDVCQYMGKFYGLCYEPTYVNNTTVIGQAPTGTTEDNEYWEYVGEV